MTQPTDQTPSSSLPKKRKLSLKQRKFAEHYITNQGNATQAAISAGYSPDTARVIGSENLTKPAIQSEIADKLTPIYTPESLQRMLAALLDTELVPGTRIKGIELAMRNLAMLTERQITDVTQHTTADELIVKAEQAITQLKHDTIAVNDDSTQEVVSNNNVYVNHCIDSMHTNTVHTQAEHEHESSMSTAHTEHDIQHDTVTDGQGQGENQATGSGNKEGDTPSAECA